MVRAAAEATEMRPWNLEVPQGPRLCKNWALLLILAFKARFSIPLPRVLSGPLGSVRQSLLQLCPGCQSSLQPVPCPVLMHTSCAFCKAVLRCPLPWTSALTHGHDQSACMPWGESQGTAPSGEFIKTNTINTQLLVTQWFKQAHLGGQELD